jgi:predicted nuclease of predicted toxin-antitoxin system
VKFVVDAQLPARLARFLNDTGHDAVHTSALPAGNRTTDAWIAEFADSEDRVVVIKDRDFRESHLLFVAAFDAADFVELGAQAMVVHRRRDQ